MFRVQGLGVSWSEVARFVAMWESRGRGLGFGVACGAV